MAELPPNKRPRCFPAEEGDADTGSGRFVVLDPAPDAPTTSDAPTIFYHPSRVPAALRLVDDSVLLILEYLVATPKVAPACKRLTPPLTGDLARLARVHSRFLGLVRGVLYRQPHLDGTLSPDNLCTCAPCRFTPSPSLCSLAPAKALAEALEVNPALGSFIRHLPRLGHLTRTLASDNVSPRLVTQVMIGILSKAHNLLTLDMPLVDLRSQEDLIRGVEDMKGLRSLTLGSGCFKSKDGTSLMHEGDLRRIARGCSELQQLTISTEHLGLSAADSWVESFPFRELRELHILHTTCVTDKHLMALVVMSRHLSSLTIINSARLDGSATPPLPRVDDHGRTRWPRPVARLTTDGIAAVLERCGATLRTLLIDVTDILPSVEPSAPGRIPSIDAALVHCRGLRHLTLLGPGLVLAESLPHLGAPPPVTRVRSFGMPPYDAYASPSPKPQGLSNLVSLTIGFYPALYPPLLAFLESLPPSATSPFTALKSITFKNPPACCARIGDIYAAEARVDALHAAVEGKAIHLILDSTSKEKREGWALTSTASSRLLRAHYDVSMAVAAAAAAAAAAAVPLVPPGATGPVVYAPTVPYPGTGGGGGAVAGGGGGAGIMAPVPPTDGVAR